MILADDIRKDKEAGTECPWVPDLEDAYLALVEENERLREALQNVMGHFDTPISRRKAGVSADAGWLLDARAALGGSHE